MFNKSNNKNDLLQNISSYLKLKKINNYLEESRIIITYAGGAESFNTIQFEKINKNIVEHVVNQRIEGKPLSKIINQKGFWKHIFFTNNDTLDPRADSEIIIENVLRDFTLSSKENLFFIDLCCGTGCLGITILHELQNSYCDFIDISEKAISVCEENIRRILVTNRCKTHISDLFLNYPIENILKADFLVCNPPYIPTKTYLKLDKETMHDPRIALDGGEDGTFLYFKIINFLVKIKYQGEIYFEIDPIIIENLEKFLLEKSLKIVYKKNDYLNLDRLIKITLP